MNGILLHDAKQDSKQATALARPLFCHNPFLPEPAFYWFRESTRRITHRRERGRASFRSSRSR